MRGLPPISTATAVYSSRTPIDRDNPLFASPPTNVRKPKPTKKGKEATRSPTGDGDGES